MQHATDNMQDATDNAMHGTALRARGDTAIAANALRLQHAPMNHAACTRQRSRQTARNMQQRWFHLKRRSTASRLHAHRFGLAGRWVDLIRIDLHSGTPLACNVQLAHTWRTTYSWSIVYTAHRCAARPRSRRRHAALNGAGCIPPTSAPGLGPCCNIYTGCTVSR